MSPSPSWCSVGFPRICQRNREGKIGQGRARPDAAADLAVFVFGVRSPSTRGREGHQHHLPLHRGRVRQRKVVSPNDLCRPSLGSRALLTRHLVWLPVDRCGECDADMASKLGISQESNATVG